MGCRPRRVRRPRVDRCSRGRARSAKSPARHAEALSSAREPCSPDRDGICTNSTKARPVAAPPNRANGNRENCRDSARPNARSRRRRRSLEMPRERGGRKGSIEAIGPVGADHRACGQSATGVGARRGAIMRRALDAERLGMLADAEVNHDMGLQRLAKARDERGGLPFGGQNPGVRSRRRPRTTGQRSASVSASQAEGLVGTPGKRAKARKQDARPLHGSRLTLWLTREGSEFGRF